MSITFEEFMAAPKAPAPFSVNTVDLEKDKEEEQLDLTNTSTEDISFDDFMGTSSRPTAVKKGRDEISVIDTQEEGYLYKSDLKEGQNASDIRKFMIARFGQDYSTASDKTNDEMVNDFITHSV